MPLSQYFAGRGSSYILRSYFSRSLTRWLRRIHNTCSTTSSTPRCPTAAPSSGFGYGGGDPGAGGPRSPSNIGRPTPQNFQLGGSICSTTVCPYQYRVPEQRLARTKSGTLWRRRHGAQTDNTQFGISSCNCHIITGTVLATLLVLLGIVLRIMFAVHAEPKSVSAKLRARWIDTPRASFHAFALETARRLRCVRPSFTSHNLLTISSLLRLCSLEPRHAHRQALPQPQWTGVTARPCVTI